jgi:hypothetical protein
MSVRATGPAEDAVTPATELCRSCGTVPHEGARFCDTCGSQLVASVDAAKYKQVTVLFADVVRSMDIAAAVDVERLREIMTELVERCAAVVVRYGGTVEYNGDGVMALFGAPLRWRITLFGGALPRWPFRRRRTGWRPRWRAATVSIFECGWA